MAIAKRYGLAHSPAGTGARPAPVNRAVARPADNQKQQTAKHGEVGTRIAHHVPESLIRVEELRNFRGRNGGRDDDQQRNRGDPRPQPQQHQDPASDFESANKVRSKQWIRKTNTREAMHAHIRIDVLQQSLRGEDQSNREAHQEYAAGAHRNQINASFHSSAL